MSSGELLAHQQAVHCHEQLFHRCQASSPAFLATTSCRASRRTILLCSSSPPATPPVRTRPVVILPGLGNNTDDYTELKASLKEKGYSATVAQVSRPDWLRNALGLLDAKYWKGMLQPHPVLDWYLDRIKAAILAAKDESEGDTKVSLVGHSAGGWLARVYMSEFGFSDIALLLSLGTPHLPPPKGVQGVIDQTRGLLDYVNKVCPGSFFAPDVEYVCVAGRFLKGERFLPGRMPAVATTGVGTLVAADQPQVGAVAETRSLEGGSEGNNRMVTLRARIVGQGYKQVCGQADVWGDGVVPEISAHLEGAKNVTVDGVYHSPVGARLPDMPWYGSAGVLEQWMDYLN